VVYNSDFVERNFATTIPGIFTLGEENVEMLAQIDELKVQEAGFRDDIANRRNTLQGADGRTGKIGELAAHRDDIQQQCWAAKGLHDAHFKAAFTGLRNNASNFCDRMLKEFAENVAELHGLEELKARAAVVFDEALSSLPLLPAVNPADLVAGENNPILAKKIIGAGDVDIAAIVNRLGSSDWMKAGIGYFTQTDPHCPFCQQTVDAETTARLKGFFDESYDRDISLIDQAGESYRAAAGVFVEALETILAEQTRYVDVAALQSLVERTKARFGANIQSLARKRSEPSSVVALEDNRGLFDEIAACLADGATKIARHHEMVANQANESERLIAEIWKFIVEENRGVLVAYHANKTACDAAIAGLNASIREREGRQAETLQALRALEAGITSVEPTVTEINALLRSFGFRGFKLATAGEYNNFYEIQRLRVVVIDDPVSSLDSDVLFIVSSLIKRVFDLCRSGGQIKQVFILTHNIYFHKEVSFDPNRSAVQCRNDESFWIVRKRDDVSVVENHPANPIKTSYELLWGEVKNENRSRMTIQNTLRRILENYFKILGNLDKDDICARFEGRDKIICNSLFSWVNDGSHSAHDDLYLSADDAVVDAYLDVFRRIFEVTQHGAHYRMMMGEAAHAVDGQVIPAPVGEAVA
jgi:wobble nucleotide-excising tRNase